MSLFKHILSQTKPDPENKKPSNNDRFDWTLLKLNDKLMEEIKKDRIKRD